MVWHPYFSTTLYRLVPWPRRTPPFPPAHAPGSSTLAPAVMLVPWWSWWWCWWLWSFLWCCPSQGPLPPGASLVEALFAFLSFPVPMILSLSFPAVDACHGFAFAIRMLPASPSNRRHLQAKPGRSRGGTFPHHLPALALSLPLSLFLSHSHLVPSLSSTFPTTIPRSSQSTTTTATIVSSSPGTPTFFSSVVLARITPSTTFCAPPCAFHSHRQRTQPTRPHRCPSVALDSSALWHTLRAHFCSLHRQRQRHQTASPRCSEPRQCVISE